MRVFVTGATGFIGTHYCRRLLDDGHHVVGLVRTQSKPAADIANRMDVIHGDLSLFDDPELEQANPGRARLATQRYARGDPPRRSRWLSRAWFARGLSQSARCIETARHNEERRKPCPGWTRLPALLRIACCWLDYCFTARWGRRIQRRVPRLYQTVGTTTRTLLSSVASMRRFAARPSSVSLGATGRASP